MKEQRSESLNAFICSTSTEEHADMFLILDLSHTSTGAGMWQINLPKEDIIMFSPTLAKISDQKNRECCSFN